MFHCFANHQSKNRSRDAHSDGIWEGPDEDNICRTFVPSEWGRLGSKPEIPRSTLNSDSLSKEVSERLASEVRCGQ